MHGLRGFRKPSGRGGKIALCATAAFALFVIAAVVTGCGSSKTKGVHGTSIAYVEVKPGNRTLHQGVVSTLRLKANTAFVVGVENGGDFTERNVKVTLLVKQKPQAISRSLTIKQIRRGARQAVVFSGFNVTEFINRIPVKVTVSQASGEVNLANNSATYQVRFAF